MIDASNEEKWDSIATEHAIRVRKTIEYYQNEISKYSIFDRRISTITLLLSVITPIFVTLATIKDIDAGWNIILQLFSIISAAGLAFMEGLRKIFAYDKRWARAYMTLLTLQRARAEYKVQRIGSVTGSIEWKTRFIAYQNLFFDTISKETEDFFNHGEPTKKT